MKKQAKKILYVVIPIIIVLAVVAGAMYMYKDVLFEKSMLVINYFDANGNKLSSGQQAVIGGVEGVKYITVTVNAKNTDKTDLDFIILDASPEIKSALTLNSKLTALPDKTVSWTSGLIDITSWVGTTKTVTVTLLATSPIRQPANKTASVAIKVDPDPVSLFDAELISSTGPSSGTNPSCTEAWSCGAWNTCMSNSQTRTCTDSNNCGTTTTRPALTQSCTSSTYVKFRTDDITYANNGAIALSTTCGGALTAYGYYTASGTGGLGSSGTCFSAGTDATSYAKIMDIPGTYTASNWIGSTLSLYYRNGAYSDYVYVCVYNPTRNAYASIAYRSTDSDASKVSISSTSIDSNKELSCS